MWEWSRTHVIRVTYTFTYCTNLFILRPKCHFLNFLNFTHSRSTRHFHHVCRERSAESRHPTLTRLRRQFSHTQSQTHIFHTENECAYISHLMQALNLHWIVDGLLMETLFEWLSCTVIIANGMQTRLAMQIMPDAHAPRASSVYFACHVQRCTYSVHRTRCGIQHKSLATISESNRDRMVLEILNVSDL